MKQLVRKMFKIHLAVPAATIAWIISTVPIETTRVSSRTRFLKYSLLLAILSISCWAQGNEGNQHTDTFKIDLALISLPATSNEGCPANTVRFDVTGSGSATNLGP